MAAIHIGFQVSGVRPVPLSRIVSVDGGDGGSGNGGSGGSGGNDDAASGGDDDPKKWFIYSGQVAFVLLGLSFVMTDVVILRVLAIIANMMDMIYMYGVGDSPLWLNIRWGALYIIVNIVQILKVLYDKRSVAFDPVKERVYELMFHDLTRVQFQVLMKEAKFIDLEPGTELCTEGQVADKLFLITDGTADSVHEE
eukprot:gene30631-38330_t